MRRDSPNLPKTGSLVTGDRPNRVFQTGKVQNKSQGRTEGATPKPLRHPKGRGKQIQYSVPLAPAHRMCFYANILIVFTMAF
jgi:hypothetical protein